MLPIRYLSTLLICRIRSSSTVWPVAAAWWTAYALFLVMPLAIVLRRVLGSFTSPLDGAGFVFTAISAVLVATTLRYLASRYDLLGPGPVSTCLLGAFTPACLLLALGISSTSASHVGQILCWSLLVASETSWWTLVWQRVERTSTRSVAPPQSSPAGPATALQIDSIVTPDTTCTGQRTESCVPSEPLGGTLEEQSESLPGNVTQQLTRMRLESGETLFGLLRGTFPAGERTTALHISFCPPFDRKPQVQVGQLDGPEVAIVVAQAETFGARLELRLSAPAQDTEAVVLEFEATTSIR